MSEVIKCSLYEKVIMDLLNPESTKRQLEVKQNPDGSVGVPGTFLDHL